jgi:hypothetical protein
MYEIEDECGKPVDPADVILAKQAADTLNRHYPGHLWAVHVDSIGGVMHVKNYNVSFKYGYLLKLHHVYTDPDLTCVMRAGGEILERCAHRRGWYQDGFTPTHIEGVRPQDQPFKGIII